MVVILAPRDITDKTLVNGCLPSHMCEGLLTRLLKVEEEKNLVKQIAQITSVSRMGNQYDVGGSCIFLI